MGILSGQSLPRFPFPPSRAGAGALAMWVWLLGSLVVASAYQSMILAILSIVDYEPTLSTSEVLCWNIFFFAFFAAASYVAPLLHSLLIFVFVAG